MRFLDTSLLDPDWFNRGQIGLDWTGLDWKCL